MALPIAQQIIEAVIARLATISIAGGFHTDSGAIVKHDRVNLEEDELGLTAFCHRETAVPFKSSGKPVAVQMEILIEGKLAVPDGEAAGPLIEALVEDIQRAVERPDRTLGGLAPEGIRYAGRTTFARLQVRSTYVQVLYLVGYHRRYGAPSERA